jgi:hypothetical protein
MYQVTYVQKTCSFLGETNYLFETTKMLLHSEKKIHLKTVLVIACTGDQAEVFLSR